MTKQFHPNFMDHSLVKASHRFPTMPNARSNPITDTDKVLLTLEQPGRAFNNTSLMPAGLDRWPHESWEIKESNGKQKGKKIAPL